MQLRQATGNKKHIFFEDVYVNELNFNHSDLIYYELINSAVISIVNVLDKKILAIKICDLNSYKIDAWFNLNFKSKTQISTHICGFLPHSISEIQNDFIDYSLVKESNNIISINTSAWTLYHQYFSPFKQNTILIIDYFDAKIGFMLLINGNLQFAHFESLETDDDFMYFLFNVLKVNDCELSQLNIKVGINFFEKHSNLFQLLDSYFDNVQLLKSEIESDAYPLIKEKLFLIDCVLNENNSRAL